MTPHTNLFTDCIQSVMLLIFVLMLFSNLAGGSSDAVLKPVFGIVSQVVGAIMTLMTIALTALFTVGFSAIASAAKNLLGSAQGSSKRNINR